MVVQTCLAVQSVVRTLHFHSSIPKFHLQLGSKMHCVAKKKKSGWKWVVDSQMFVSVFWFKILYTPMLCIVFVHIKYYIIKVYMSIVLSRNLRYLNYFGKKLDFSWSQQLMRLVDYGIKTWHQGIVYILGDFSYLHIMQCIHHYMVW